MKLFNTRERIRNVAARWQEQYPDNKPGLTDDKREITRKLLALDVERATPADVAAIIGNTSWTHATCDECGGTAVDAVELEHRYGGSTFTLCAVCAQVAGKAAELLAKS